MHYNSKPVMSSIKKTMYNVKLKPIPERKRRKSDLVIMWNSICEVTTQIFVKMYISLLDVWEYTRLWLWHDEIRDIQNFLKSYLPHIPDDFSNSWRDGKLLCILLNKLQPGCISEAEKLDPNYGLRNMYHAFDVLESKFGITPTATVEQLVVCIDGSDRKLLEILFHLKEDTENKVKIPKITVETNEFVCEKQNNCSESKVCVVKGTGLMVAFVGRAANFNIFCSSVLDLNLVIEIKGPLNTICRERITKRSPKKKQSTSQLERKDSHSLYRSKSYIDKTKIDVLGDSEKNLIPLEYDIYMNQIRVTYTPRVEGQHIVSILWQGEHVSDSPYIIYVEPRVESNNITKSRHRNLIDENHESKENTKKYQESFEKIERIGRVIKRKVLRHIVKIKGKDIVVNSNDIDHLAAALLKMDYDFQTDPSKSRRNSWGFAGDAERKISVIRQFCVPPHEMEAQHLKLQRRSRSLTPNPEPQFPLKRSNSFENEDIQQTRLETVSEGLVTGYAKHFTGESEKDEHTFAYLDEEFQTVNGPREGTEVEGATDNTSINKFESEENKYDENNHTSLSFFANNIVEEVLHPLLNTYSDVSNGNDLNAKYHEELLLDDLTRASEFPDEQANETKKTNETEVQNVQYQENPQENNDTLNEASKNGHKLFCTNAKIQQNKLYNENRNFVDRNEFEGINENVRDRNMSNFEKNSENFRPSSPNFTKKYTNLIKRLEELCIVPKVYFELNYRNKKIIRKKVLSTYQCSTRCNFLDSRKYNKRECEYKKRGKLCNISSSQRRKKKKSKATSKTSKRSEQYYSNKNIEEYSVQISNNVNLKNSELKNNKPSEKIKFSSLNSSYLENSNIVFNELNDKNMYQNCSSIGNRSSFKPDIPNYAMNQEDSDHPKREDMICVMKNTVTAPTNLLKAHIGNSSLSSIVDSDYASLRRMSSDIRLNFPHDDVRKEANISNVLSPNLSSLGQYNFKQFNPSLESSRGSIIKNKIKKLEMAVKLGSQNATPKTSLKNDILTEKVDIKAKLAFWENAYRNDKQSHQANVQEISEERSTERNALTNPTNLVDTDLLKRKSRDFPTSIDGLDDQIYDSTLMNQAAVTSWTKLTDNKLSSELDSTPKSKRSFSDPAVLDLTSRENFYTEQCHSQIKISNKFNPNSSTDNLSSSIDAEYWDSSIDDDICSADIFLSTEDEYIDDEIPDSNTLFTHWGDISLTKKLNASTISSHKEHFDSIDTEILKNPCITSSPAECKVYGIGTYYGYVAIKNRFRVLTKGAGSGNLSVSVQGFGRHDVSYVSVKYTQKDIYEVTYQVMRPGLYLISLRWMETPIVGSPFLCKITF